MFRLLVKVFFLLEESRCNKHGNKESCNCEDYKHYGYQDNSGPVGFNGFGDDAQVPVAEDIEVSEKEVCKRGNSESHDQSDFEAHGTGAADGYKQAEFYCRKEQQG